MASVALPSTALLITRFAFVSCSHGIQLDLQTPASYWEDHITSVMAVRSTVESPMERTFIHGASLPYNFLRTSDPIFRVPLVALH